MTNLIVHTREGTQNAQAIKIYKIIRTCKQILPQICTNSFDGLGYVSLSLRLNLRHTDILLPVTGHIRHIMVCLTVPL